ncbi:MAG: hypothetical protein IPP48_09730 [Chitinophagaceae bacterium]|nr:hypothetical protein [Chitinophagaceae bacterium]
MKLPVIFQHFIEHQQKDKNISFLAFLDMHYMHGTPKDKDYNRDMQLPFKTFGHHSSSLTVAFIPVEFSATKFEPSSFCRKTLCLTKGQFLPFSYLSCIWNPPKFC